MDDRLREAQEHYERGDQLDKVGDTARAIDEWKRAIQLNPNYFDAHYNLGIAYADEGNLDTAIDELESAFAIEQEDKDARRELARLLTERGEARLAQGNRMGAAADWNRTLELDSENANVHFYLGREDVKDRDYSNAIRHFRAAISNNRFFTNAYVRLADVYLADNSPSEAIDTLRQALNVFHVSSASRGLFRAHHVKDRDVANYVDLSELARKLARLELEGGDPDQAMAALENAQPSNKNAELWKEISDEFETRGDPESAEIAANRAAETEQNESVENESPAEEIKSGVADAHFTRAELLYDQGHSEDAFEEYTEAIRLNPEHALAHHSLGVIYQDDEEYDFAEKEFRESLRIDPNCADAHFGLGEIFDVRQDWQNASSEYREVLRIAPDDQAAKGNLIWDLLEMDDLPQAQAELEQAKLEMSAAVDLWEELGKAYEERGSRGSAIAAYQRALKYDKNAREARERLKRLGVN